MLISGCCDLKITLKIMCEYCFVCSQDMLMFPYKPVTILEISLTVVRHEALNLHVMLWV
jgi:hypothetical protein